jgi:hypothetical protein
MIIALCAVVLGSVRKSSFYPCFCESDVAFCHWYFRRCASSAQFLKQTAEARHRWISTADFGDGAHAVVCLLTFALALAGQAGEADEPPASMKSWSRPHVFPAAIRDELLRVEAVLTEEIEENLTAAPGIFFAAH